MKNTVAIIVILGLAACATPGKFETPEGCKPGWGTDEPMACPPADMGKNCKEIAPDIFMCEKEKS
jgi:hypothetical protein